MEKIEIGLKIICFLMFGIIGYILGFFIGIIKMVNKQALIIIPIIFLYFMFAIWFWTKSKWRLSGYKSKTKEFTK